jgi:hypothetical protein
MRRFEAWMIDRHDRGPLEEADVEPLCDRDGDFIRGDDREDVVERAKLALADVDTPIRVVIVRVDATVVEELYAN